MFFCLLVANKIPYFHMMYSNWETLSFIINEMDQDFYLFFFTH